MKLKQAALLKALFERISQDATVVTLVSTRVFNHVPQSTPTFPYIRFFLVTNNDWSDKLAQGLETELQVDVWSDKRGDNDVLLIADAIIAALHNLPLTLPTDQQNVMVQHVGTTTLVEGDGITHHGIIRFRLLSTSNS